jgi:hypothetical protein
MLRAHEVIHGLEFGDESYDLNRNSKNSAMHTV